MLMCLWMIEWFDDDDVVWGCWMMCVCFDVFVFRDG